LEVAQSAARFNTVGRISALRPPGGARNAEAGATGSHGNDTAGGEHPGQDRGAVGGRLSRAESYAADCRMPKFRLQVQAVTIDSSLE
jgi:hypothetical protein